MGCPSIIVNEDSLKISHFCQQYPRLCNCLGNLPIIGLPQKIDHCLVSFYDVTDNKKNQIGWYSYQVPLYKYNVSYNTNYFGDDIISYMRSHNISLIRIVFVMNFKDSNYEIPSGGDSRSDFTYWAKYWGDSGYGGCINSDAARCGSSITGMVEKITLTTDKYYDARHPAGSSLNDILIVAYSSSRRFIQSRYNPKILANTNISDGTETIIESLEEFNIHNCDNYLMEPAWAFYITVPPEKSDTFRISVVYKEFNEILPTVVEGNFPPIYIEAKK